MGTFKRLDGTWFDLSFRMLCLIVEQRRETKHYHVRLINNYIIFIKYSSRQQIKRYVRADKAGIEAEREKEKQQLG